MSTDRIILNSGEASSSASVPDLDKALNDLMVSLKSEYITETGVNYKALAKSELFRYGKNINAYDIDSNACFGGYFLHCTLNL